MRWGITSVRGPQPSTEEPPGPAAARPRGADAAAREYAETGAREAREILVSLCEPLVRGVASNYDNPALSDDLVQVGFVGLLNAIEHFDPVWGTPFVVFARPYIRGEISHYLRDYHTTVRRPRWLEHVNGQIDQATREHLGEQRRYPGLSDLATALGIDEGSLVEILRTRQTVRTLSLDTEDAEGQPVVDLAQSARQTAPVWEVKVEDRMVLIEALQALSPTQRTVVFYIFFTDFTQMDAARRMGVSQKHVSRVLATALLRLRQLLPLREDAGCPT